MKVLILTLGLFGCALCMPVGVEQDQPRSVVPLVITDYSSVASMNAEDAPTEVQPVASEDKQDTAATPAVEETPIDKAQAPSNDNQENVSSDP